MHLYVNKPDSAGDVMCANYGYYIVGTKFFFSQVDALAESDKTDLPVYHSFYDDVFVKAHKQGIWKTISLPQLYIQRAKQLRQMYDVVAVNSSGGWDSRNILDSFEAAGCQVDFIIVQSVSELMNCGRPGDISHDNWITEITDVALPHAKAFCERNPKTKLIVLDNWFTQIISDFTSKRDNVDDIFRQSSSKPGIMYRRNSDIQNNPEFMKALVGGKVACVLNGIDKPLVSHTNLQSAFGMFPENMLTRFKIPKRSAGYHENIIHESFYWTPFMPEIAIRGWYELMALIKTDRLVAASTNNAIDRHIRADMLLSLDTQDRIKRLIYPKYDPTVWTVGKPRDWGFLFTLEMPLIKVLDSIDLSWRDKFNELLTGLKNVVGKQNVVTKERHLSRNFEDGAQMLGNDEYFFKYREVRFMRHMLMDDVQLSG